MLIAAAALILLMAGIAGWRAVAGRWMQLWLPAYLRGALRGQPRPAVCPVHIMLAIADHFEPGFAGASYERECERVDRWVREYPALAARHRDADGKPPRYTFFYPEEQYRPEHLERLAALCRRGFADVEIHLHHDGDTARDLREKLVRFKETLRREHGLLHVDPDTGSVEYAFIHGDWALDNSARNGAHCGVNNELTVLCQTGCYADFTLPSAPSETQTRKINSIYYAADDPERPKSHDTGRDVKAGEPAGGGLMIVQGPLALNWKSRKWGVFPRTENGELSGDYPPTRARADLWVKQHIHVQERPEWIFIKLHTHGSNERNMDTLLGRPLDELFSYLESRYNDGIHYRLHYVTAREMYNIIKAAEAGQDGSPNQFRDFRHQPKPGRARCEQSAW
jgi:hypothetical protein